MKKIINKIKKKIFIFNSLKNKKELFIPIKKNKINMYVCGPTLYKNIHLSNCRTFIFFDIIYRFFKHLKFKIKYIRNITDINHENLNLNFFYYMKLINNYKKNFKKILKKFNLLSPDLEPHITSNITEQIVNIEKIIKYNLAYKINGSIYFDINKYNKKKKKKYGFILNKKNINKQKNLKKKFFNEKKNFYDFSLWKNLIENKKNIKWYSEWSLGIPSWHIGCSTLSNKYLGDFLDIHGGGLDLKFPHHECEIVQSNIINNNKKNLAKYWIHTNMLTINSKKMSKSLKNFIYPEDLIKGKLKITKNEKINPFIIKLFFLQTHYRKKIKFSLKTIKNTYFNYKYILNFFKKIKNIKLHKISTFNINILCIKCYKSIIDDFNTPLLIKYLIKINKVIDKCLINEIKINKKDFKKLKKIMKIFIIDILGLKPKKNKKKNKNKKKLINKLLKFRNEIRKKKL
ncbi:MAG: cysteine--tRNA ligase, partial [Candidatus Shikimatogenerans sp. JK-2022]|nr:cysteine--tRNA ligase [Candidatus Shikimatogenerans bostrichidophilus]